MSSDSQLPLLTSTNSNTETQHQLLPARSRCRLGKHRTTRNGALVTGRTHLIIGSLTGFVVVGLWLNFIPELFTPDASPTALDRIVLGLRWTAVLQLPLIIGILTVGQQRFWLPEYADGSAPDVGSPLEINKRYLTNTVEQTLLATVGMLALSITVPVTDMNFVPALAILFVLGRISFWVGYHINPYARAFGLVLTFAPTIGVYVNLLWDVAGW